MSDWTRERLAEALDAIKEETLRAFDEGVQPVIRAGYAVKESPLPDGTVARVVNGRGLWRIDLDGEKIEENALEALAGVTQRLERIERHLLDLQAVNRAMASPLSRERGGLRRAT